MDAHQNACPQAALSPFGLALYSFAFRSGPPARHIEDALGALTAGVASDVIDTSFQEIESELARPMQNVCEVLPGNRRSEQECREFLQLILQRRPRDA